MRFDSEEFGKESIIRETRATWLTINTQTKQTLSYSLQRSKLHLQDKLLNFDDWTEIEEESVFQFAPLPVKSYEKSDNSV